jgi:imidazolonepropionase-like amidohydrolase
MTTALYLCRYLAAALLLGTLAIQPAGAEAVVLESVRIIDGLHSRPIENGVIVIENERILAAGTKKEVIVPPVARTIDLSGKTVLSGLISDHSHLGLVEGARSGGQYVTGANILRQLRQYEAYGVTTVVSLGLNRAPFYELQPALHAGAQPGADMFGADRGFGVEAGAPPVRAGILVDEVYRPASAEQARAEVRESAARHPDLIKLWVDDFHGTVPVKMSPEIYRAIIDEAHRQHLRVAAHIYYLEDARRLVAGGVDILAHGVRDQPVDAAFIEAVKARGVWYIPTLGLDEDFYLFAVHPELIQQPILAQALQPALREELEDPGWRARVLADSQGLDRNRRSLENNLKNVKTMFDAGVRIGFGADSGAVPLRIAGFAEHHELKLLVGAGLTPLQAILTATRNAADLLALPDRGVIAPGKLADLLIVDGNPAEHIEDMDRIEAVWHRGRQVAGPLADFQP